MKEIPLTQGKVALVDDSDYAAVSAFKWHAHKSKNGFYARRTIWVPGGKGKQIIVYLHRFLLPGIPEIDHKDGDGLNCQRENLRPASHFQNLQGFQKKRSDCTSLFRGVSWHGLRKKWRAAIQFNKQYRYLGLFEKEEMAARAYDVAAAKFCGEFASLNFP